MIFTVIKHFVVIIFINNLTIYIFFIAGETRTMRLFVKIEYLMTYVERMIQTINGAPKNKEFQCEKIIKEDKYNLFYSA